MIAKVKECMDTGNNMLDCLVKTLIKSWEAEKLSWEDMCFITASFTMGGIHLVRLILHIGYSSYLKLTTTTDVQNHQVVPCNHAITPRGSSQSSQRAQPCGQKREMAYCR